MAKRSKLEQAMSSASQPAQKQTSAEAGYYDDKDVLKHYIRKYYWLKRVKDLQRDVPVLKQGVSYFSFCSRYAFDARYFVNQSVIDQTKDKVNFGFVEYMKDDYEFLANQYIGGGSMKGRAMGFHGSFADIATNTEEKDFGKFWSSFPYDVINLDYLGDILKIGKIGQNDFYAIQAVIAKQSFLRRPYELWITMRAKEGRYDSAVKHAFREIIKHNQNGYPKFKEKFDNKYAGMDVSALNDDDLFLVGYLKWLCFVCKQSYSTLQLNKLQIIKYERKDKDDQPYYLYNIFLRINPFEHIVIPSPASEAARFCDDEYINSILKCFENPIDIMGEFKKLDAGEKAQLRKELGQLKKEYEEDSQGYLQ